MQEERRRTAGGTQEDRRGDAEGPLVARIDIGKIGLYLEMVMSVLDHLVRKLRVRVFK